MYIYGAYIDIYIIYMYTYTHLCVCECVCVCVFASACMLAWMDGGMDGWMLLRCRWSCY